MHRDVFEQLVSRFAMFAARALENRNCFSLKYVRRQTFLWLHFFRVGLALSVTRALGRDLVLSAQLVFEHYEELVRVMLSGIDEYPASWLSNRRSGAVPSKSEGI